ncbi:PspA/IM30 family protein [Aliikangiella coralliicola]|uniref:PspA/IM30 family protein n=1 Tax=Aliikangiella coralliicola TaxID=2592383 RepID=A0A545UGC1_9GAMM|nr:PspA/IM30 family protein [Aliikangiella coralliicola]TQV88518.1 PspA/IM30 family protein [Aliikangiella coralliicola]
MSIFKKLVTAIRGGAREIGEAVVDTNAIRILEQEIVDQENAIAKAKDALTGVMADESKTARQINAIKDRIGEHEGYATQALEKGDEALALEVAEKIAEYENELAEMQPVLDSYKASVQSLKDQIRKAEKCIQENKRELSVVKTTESVQKARVSVNSSLSSGVSKSSAARESLNRIKERQQRTEDKIKASEELNAENTDAALKSKLEAAGIGKTKSQASDILARLKK